jgi:hypothetical protein
MSTPKSNPMKKIAAIFTAAALLSPIVCAQVEQPNATPLDSVQQVGPPGNNAFAITEAGPHHRRWSKMSQIAMADGSLRTVTNSYVELAIGLNRLDANNRWTPAAAMFEIINGAAVARGTAHQVILTSPTDTLPVDVLTPDGQRLSSRVLGISYYSAMTGKSVLIAEPRQSQGKFVPPNRVIYEDCFDGGFRADLAYTVTLGGLEQDLIIRERPPSPLEAGFQVSDSYVRLELLTEFLNAPAPTVQDQVLGSQSDPVVRTQMATPDFDDQTLWFGATHMSHGSAFQLGESPLMPISNLPTGKTWQNVNGRNILFEAIDLDAAAPILEQLPAHPQASNNRKRKGLMAKARVNLLPNGRANPSRSPIILAHRATPTRGLVLDYLIINGNLTNYTFQGDTTYYLTNTVTLYGTTTIEGGTVIKFDHDNYPVYRVELVSNGPIICNTDPYRPAVLTAKDDDTVGEVLPTSNGTPSGTYSAYNLYAYSTGPIALQNLRSRYAWVGLCIVYQSGHTIRDCQIVDCTYGVVSATSTVGQYPSIAVRNALIDQPSFSGFAVWQSAITAEHLTLRDANQVFYVGNTNFSSLMLTNSIIAGLTNSANNYTNSSGATLASSSGVFQTVGAGSLYLADNTYRNQGTTSIDPVLLASLKQRTTYPPIVLTGAISGNLTLSPVVQRDIDVPDYGYHYPPLDYVFGGPVITNATIVLTNGVAIGTYGTRGILLSKGSILISEGTPIQPNRLGHINRVQEQATFVSGNSTNDWLAINDDANKQVELHLRYSDLSLLAGSITTMNAIGNITWIAPGIVEIANSYMRGTYQDLYTPTNLPITVTISNTFWERDTWNYTQDGVTAFPIAVSLYNNLFRGGTVRFYHNCTNLNWTVHDNLFDCDTLYTQGSNLDAAQNGYRNGVTALSGEYLPKTGLYPDYQSGAITNYLGYLGNYYYPTSGSSTSLTNLINTGSRAASAAGLYHYTTTTNQVIEGTTQVDVGFHYIALGGSGNPIDTDGDGFPDYLEDRNGNGTVDSGETDWQSATDAGLKAYITEPKGNSNIP